MFNSNNMRFSSVRAFNSVYFIVNEKTTIFIGEMSECTYWREKFIEEKSLLFFQFLKFDSVYTYILAIIKSYITWLGSTDLV